MLEVSKYNVKRPLLGKQVVVSFDCPQCESSLKCKPSEVGHADQCAFCNVQFTLDKKPLERFLANEQRKAQQHALEKKEKQREKDKLTAERSLKQKDKREAEHLQKEQDKLEEFTSGMERQRQIDEARRKQARQDPMRLSTRADKAANWCEWITIFTNFFGVVAVVLGVCAFPIALIVLSSSNPLTYGTGIEVFVFSISALSLGTSLLITRLLFESLAIFLLHLSAEDLARVDE